VKFGCASVAGAALLFAPIALGVACTATKESASKPAVRLPCDGFVDVQNLARG
jgi:hypothetical protein